jgi:predicted MPP superfamily phosphohydrolase
MSGTILILAATLMHVYVFRRPASVPFVKRRIPLKVLVGAGILLSHTPWEAERAAVAGAGLMLSGHTHGGQIWPFGYLTRIVYPLFDGEYDVDGMKVIVSRGTGTWGTRMRLWRPAQILRITLRATGTSHEGSRPL